MRAVMCCSRSTHSWLGLGLGLGLGIGLGLGLGLGIGLGLGLGLALLGEAHARDRLALLEALQVGAPRVGARYVLVDELEARACAG